MPVGGYIAVSLPGDRYCRSVRRDEFALVLPEAREEEAQRVATRIRETLAADLEHPSLSASIGASIYHGEGERVDRILKEADQNLYEEKSRRKEASKPVDSSRRKAPKKL